MIAPSTLKTMQGKARSSHTQFVLRPHLEAVSSSGASGATPEVGVKRSLDPNAVV